MSDELRLVRVRVEHIAYVWASPAEVHRAVVGSPDLRMPGVTNIDGDALLDLVRRCASDLQIAENAFAELVEKDEDGWVGVEDWHIIPAHPGVMS